MTYRPGRHWRVTIVDEPNTMACEHCEADIRPGDPYAIIPGSGGLVQCAQHAANLGEIRVRDTPPAQLAAVVMAGKVLTTDPELAERVCALLNANDAEWSRAIAHGEQQISAAGLDDLKARILASMNKPPTVLPHTPDVDYLRGVSEALAFVRHELDRACPPSLGPGCICNDPPPTTTGKNTPATRPPGWACPRHGVVI